MQRLHLRPLVLFAALFAAQTSFAFEDTKVLPANIRRVSLRLVNTEFSTRTDGAGNSQSLADPLQKDITFKDVLKNEKNPTQRSVLAGYLNSKSISEDQKLMRIDAELNGRITVFAPIVTYGLTNRLTVAIAAPVYNGATTLGVGTRKTTNADAFTASFAGDRDTNCEECGREAADKLTNVLNTVNLTAEENGRARLDKNDGQWKDVGFGDITVLTKYRFVDDSVLKLAAVNGFVAPTGRVDDPYIATDLPFGDGQWDLFSQLSCDQELYKKSVTLTLNQYGKYTWQLPSRRMMPVLTNETNALDAGVSRVSFKLGDKVDAGTAILLDSQSGFGGGIGYNYSRKFSDIYRADAESKALLERDTDVQMHQAEAEVSYTTIPAYYRQEFAVPFETKLSYKKHLQSRNSPVTSFLQVETGVFF